MLHSNLRCWAYITTQHVHFCVPSFWEDFMRLQPSVLCQGVIGAGAAGLVAARELAREGHQPTVFEQGSRAGGVWVYTDAVEEADMPGDFPAPHLAAVLQLPRHSPCLSLRSCHTRL